MKTKFYLFVGLLLLTANLTLHAKWNESAPRICVDPNGGNPKLKITTDPTNYGTLFQFGSVIAWNYGNEGSANYNPTGNGGLSTWNSDWRGAPEHTNSNLRVGKGDPCRLAGYTQSYVAAAIGRGEAPDNGEWRLPTETENADFTGGSTAYDIDGLAVNGKPGLWFPRNGSKANGFLPAAGYRYAGGSCGSQGSHGYYWSSTPNGDTGYFLYFSSSYVNPQNNHYQAFGFSVRCVRQ